MSSSGILDALRNETAKRTDPAKRGRFNLGEKEIIAVALSAEIETTGTTVSFPAEGGRTTAPNGRVRGTRVRVTMPWTEADAQELRQEAATLPAYRLPADGRRRRNPATHAALQDIMAETTLNAMHAEMPGESFSEGWVRTAIEDERIEDKAVAAVKKNRYGENAVVWSSDTDANMRAAEAGYQVIHPKAMSHTERKVLAEKAGLQSAKKEFGRVPETKTPEKANDIRRSFATWVRRIGRALNLRVKVRFVSAHGASFVAQCTSSKSTPTVTFNTNLCPDAWLAERGPEQLELIIHELAHAVADTPMEHGPKWGDGCAAAGAMLADAITRGRMTYSPGPMPRVTNQNIDSALKPPPAAV